MAKPQGDMTDQKETRERHNRPPAVEGARERLLAGLRVTERRLRLNDLSTAVLEGGDGPPVVLLHGLGEYAAKWLRVIPNLMTTHRVIAPDIPGHGTSDVIDGPLDVNRMLAWLDDLIECTCPTAPTLVGHVLGGAIAARFASDRSASLSRLVLVDSLGLAPFQPTPDFALALTEFVSKPTEDAHDRLWRRGAFDLDAMRNRMGEQWEALRFALGNSKSSAALITPKRDTRAAWDKIAPGYDRTNTPTQMWLGNEGLRRAGLRRGMRFLDVAAGSGALSIPAARLGAQVLATDQSPVMLELLRARAVKERLDIETGVMDGQALELADNSFDMVGSQFGVMLFPDMPKGISEMVRVAKPGGGVLLHAYGDLHRIEFLGFLIGAVQSVRPDFNGPPMEPPPLEFQLADPERLRKELATAGLKDIRIETVTETTEFQSGDALWEWLVWSNPIVEIVLGSLNLLDDEISAVKQTLERMVRERAGSSDAARLTNPINIGIGTK